MKKLLMTFAAIAAVILSQGLALANTARDYVQDGLVAQWDGIENAGRGTRAENPTVWKDLVGSSDITLPDWVSVTSDQTGFLSTGVNASRTGYPELDTIPGLTNKSVTVEVVSRRGKWYVTDGNYERLLHASCSPWGQFGYRNNTDYGLFINFNGTVRNNESTGVNVKTINTLAGRFNHATSQFQGELFANGTKLTIATKGPAVDLMSTWQFFRSSYADLEFYAIRIYNRQLTDAELCANAAVDKARFIDKDYVIWDPELTNAGRNDADFVWKTPYGMTLPVTARIVTGFRPDLSDGVVHTLDTVSDQSEVTSHFTFVRGDATYWRAEAVDADGKTCNLGVRLMPDVPLVVDSCSYEDDGLVAQWDGIENAGRGTRAENPTVWKDLVGSSDIMLPDWVSVTSDQTGFLSTGVNGDRTGYPELDTIPGLANKSVTVEVVSRRGKWYVTDGNYRRLLQASCSPWGQFGYRDDTDYGLFINFNGTVRNNESTGVNVKTINTLAGRFNHATSQFQGELFANGTKLTIATKGDKVDLTSTWQFFRSSRADLEFYAIRIYNRQLTDAELCANAAVDRYRFLDDKSAVVPLLMQFDGPGAAVRTDLSFWTLPGETFSYRVDRLVPQGGRQSVCLGWTLYVEAGADSWTEQSHGETCDFSYLPDGRRYRLVWHTATAADVADGYIVRDYLESSGQQTLNTGYQPNPSTKVALDLSLHGTFQTGVGGALFGTVASAANLQLACNFGGNANENRTLYWWTRCDYKASETRKMAIGSDVILSSRNQLSLDVAAGRGSYGSSVVDNLIRRDAGQSQVEPVCLFGTSAKPFAAYPNMRVYSAMLSDGDEPRFDGVPAVSQETGKCGLYDCVSGQLFTNCVVDATEDFTVGGVSPCIYVEGEPSRLGEPTIPYGCVEIANGATFALSETNLVDSGGRKLSVKAIERYELDSTSGQWSFVDRTRGASVEATHNGVPTKYVLKWEPRYGLILIFK